MPDCAVPNQYASTSSLLTPAPVNASPLASMMRSSSPLSQCSANRVQPIATMATRSRMPLLLIRFWLHDRPCLPEVVGDAIGGEQPAEGHLHPHADGHVAGIDIGQLDRQPLAVVEVNDREDHGWAR